VTGLIETVRVRAGAAPLWSLHLARLGDACRALGIDLPPLEAPGGGDDRIVRIEVRSGGTTVSERAVAAPDPLRLVVAGEPYAAYPLKTTDRAQFDRALAEAAVSGADDGVLLAPSGVVAEAARWGIFWWQGGRVAAPPLALGILRSVARARIGALLGGIEELEVRPDELAGRAIFAANAARGIVEVMTWNGHAVPGDAQTDVLRARFWP
jgi:branched-subunit amino acid aminotransferase/4-amino-4-deoxychorismate lyase